MKENKEYQEKKEQKKVVHEPTGSYGMDTITMRQKIMERVMLMEENQLKEMLRFSNELEQKSWLLPHTQEELEIAINRGMEEVINVYSQDRLNQKQRIQKRFYKECV